MKLQNLNKKRHAAKLRRKQRHIDQVTSRLTGKPVRYVMPDEVSAYSSTPVFASSTPTHSKLQIGTSVKFTAKTTQQPIS